MHIAEGVLSLPIIVTGAAGCAVALWWGLKRLPQNNLMTAGLVSAAFFVASLIHVPVGFSSSHLILNGLVGIMLGAASYPVIFVALLLQGVLFGFGGLTVLGVNTLTMGTGAVIAGWVYWQLVDTQTISVKNDIVAFFAGMLGVFLAALFTACALAFSHEGFKAAAVALFVAHIPIMVVEGVVTLLVCRILARSKKLGWAQ